MYLRYVGTDIPAFTNNLTDFKLSKAPVPPGERGILINQKLPTAGSRFSRRG